MGSWMSERGVKLLYRSSGHGRYGARADWTGFSARIVQLLRGGRRR
jgi:hypothetical protein